MYLMAVVMVVIGMLSIYAQILTAQAARFAASQYGLGQTMLDWHSAAISMGASLVSSGAFNPTTDPPCGLTYTIPYGGPLHCNAICLGDGAATLTGLHGTDLHHLDALCTTTVYLPPGYNGATYQFYSVLYADAAKNPYVVTFVLKPTPGTGNPAPGFISLPSLPNAQMMNFTLSDLYRQLRLAGTPDYAYGTWNSINTNLVSPYIQYGTTVGAPAILYKIPAAAGITNGSVAIVSSTSGFLQ